MLSNIRKGAADMTLRRITKLVVKLFLYCWCIFTVFALLWVLLSSLKTNNEFFSKTWGLFKVPQVSNYAKVLFQYNLGKGFINSIFVVTLSIIGILMVSAPAAYILARIPFPFRGALAKFIILGMGIPVQLLLVPLFFTLSKLKLIDDLWGLILVYIALSLPYNIFLIMGFFRSLPHELEEAARIDGCSMIKTFIKIILPLGQPALVTCTVFLFIDLINEFMLAYTFISSESKQTVSVGLAGLQTSMLYTGDWVALFAGLTIAIMPMAVIYIFLSRSIIEGITVGAVKG